jgi:hypothetical protein
MKKILAGTMVTLSLACQTYSAMPFDGLRAGNNVRMTVTNEGSLAVEPTVGRDIQFVEGRVQSIDSAGVTLRVESVNRGGTDVTERVDTAIVRLPASGISGTQLRRVDKRRSFLVAGLITVGALLIAQSTGDGGFLGLGHGGSTGSR